jgi:hypothetical protein
MERIHGELPGWSGSLFTLTVRAAPGKKLTDNPEAGGAGLELLSISFTLWKCGRCVI